MALSIFRNNSNKAILLGLITFLSACGGGGSGNKNSIDSINSSKAETTNSSATISQSPNVSNNSSIISATSSTATQLFAQRLEFLYTTVNLIAGDSLGNIAGGASKGPISYASSNTEIATVNESGVVTAKAPGTAIITETIAADQFYAAASASYTVNVKALANQAL